MNNTLNELALTVLDCVERLDNIDDNASIIFDKLASISNRLDELELKIAMESKKSIAMTSAS